MCVSVCVGMSERAHEKVGWARGIWRIAIIQQFGIPKREVVR